MGRERIEFKIDYVVATGLGVATYFFILLPWLRVHQTGLMFEVPATLFGVCLLVLLLFCAKRLAPSVLQPVAWALIGLLILVSSIAQILSLIAAAVPYSESARVRPTEVTLPIVGAGVQVSGLITFEMRTALERSLGNDRTITHVILDSPGGNVFAARGIILLIEERGLGTRVNADCLSACALVFLAGSTRTLGNKGRLGFHGYSVQTKGVTGEIVMTDVSAEEAKDKAYFAKQGVAPEFTKRVFETPPNQIWTPSKADLTKANVLKSR